MEKFFKKQYTRPEIDDLHFSVKSPMLGVSTTNRILNSNMEIGIQETGKVITADSKERYGITIDHNDDYYDDDDALW